MTAVFGKLQVFDQRKYWKTWNSLLIVMLFVATQLLMNFQVQQKVTAGQSVEIRSAVAYSLSVTRLLLIVWFGRMQYKDLWMHLTKRKNGAPMPNDKYKSMVLLVLVTVYTLVRVLTRSYYMGDHKALKGDAVIIVRMVMLMFLALGGAVLPGRMIRKGLIAMKVCRFLFSTTCEL